MAKSFDVAVMHDFFVDRLVPVSSVSSFLGVAESKSRAGGGSVHGVKQYDVRGGNAVNLAHALARLGAKVLLITHSDEGHEGMLRAAFDGLDAEVIVKPRPPGMTLALEGQTNVMLSDSGGAGDFPPSLLDSNDWGALRRSGVVCSVNWAANQHGTRLLLALRRRLGPKKPIFLSTSDVRDRLEEYRDLIDILRSKRVIDWLSLNEYEAISCCRALNLRASSSEIACKEIAGRLRARVDVHTETASYTCSGGLLTARRVRRLNPIRLTGAGDVWDAASIFALLKGMNDGDRLGFANAAARLYLKADGPTPPTLPEVENSL